MYIYYILQFVLTIRPIVQSGDNSDSRHLTEIGQRKGWKAERIIGPVNSYKPICCWMLAFYGNDIGETGPPACVHS